MAMEGVFELTTPAHLLGKLEREYERWKADPVNSDFAWNFFVTAEHLPDWLARSDSQALGGKSINAFKHDGPLLRICSHIANGGKHFRPSPEHTSVDRTVREMTDYAKDGYVKRAISPRSPRCGFISPPMRSPRSSRPTSQSRQKTLMPSGSRLRS
jgi:hypothetical protein